MAVRRTLKQKQRAQVHRQTELTYSLSPQAPPKDKPSLVSHAEPSLSLKLFGYNPRLVYNDLLKTLIVTGIVVVILIGIFILTR